MCHSTNTLVNFFFWPKHSCKLYISFLTILKALSLVLRKNKLKLFLIVYFLRHASRFKLKT